MQETPGTTEDRIALIAQASLDPEEALQLLVKIFDTPDYLAPLRDHPQAQQYIDSLYKVCYYCFCK